MPDRTDIDALLIGALYGELTPAEEARLTAHLESHPADRTALSDLTRTRAAVRDSRILAFQLEPPQAISALLLREASRRAPQREASWFQRLARSFMAHPAMAAAAMLVLVVSVAGTLYLRGGDQFAASRAPAPALPVSDPTVATGEAPPAAAAPAPEKATARSASDAEKAGAQGAQLQQTESTGAGAAGSAETYRVRLDEANRSEGALREQAVATPPSEHAKGGAKDRAPEPAPARAKLAKKLAGIEVRTEQPRIEPKELNDDDTADLVKRDAVRRGGAGAGRPSNAPQASGAAGPTGGGAPPPPPSPAAVSPSASRPMPASPPAAMAVPDQAPSAEPAADPRAGNEAKQQPAKPAPAARPAATPPPPAPRSNAVAPGTGDSANARDGRRADKAGANDAKTVKAEDKPAHDKATLDWARKQKDQVIALVGANNCPAAASAAGEIYSRVPDYYATHIVNDRSIRPCLAYLNNERERQDRKAAKRAIQADDAATRDQNK